MKPQAPPNLPKGEEQEWANDKYLAKAVIPDTVQLIYNTD
jgi:hypothetical protein